MPTSRQRRDAERRRLARQYERRLRRNQRRRRLNVLMSVGGALVLIAVVVSVIVATKGSDSTPAAGSGTATSIGATSAGATFTGTPSTGTPTTSTPTTGTPTTATSSAATSSAAPSSAARSSSANRTVTRTVTCTYRAGDVKAARAVHRPASSAPASGTTQARLNTSRGPIVVTLDRATAPCAVQSFVSLARQGYYNRTRCHRLTTSGIYVVQCGDPTGTGAGGPGYVYNDELTGKERYTRGVLAMANGGANTNGSQFFIVYRASALGAQYTIFGRVAAGLGVVDRVAAAGTTNGSTDGTPKLSLQLQTVSVL